MGGKDGMSTLLRADNTPIDCIINQTLPYLDAIKVKQRLLDGTVHNQNIGNAVQMVNVVLYCDSANMEIINTAFATGEPITLITDKIYTGTISEKPAFEVITRNFYKGTFTLEGAV
jgi:hypothetical protein